MCVAGRGTRVSRRGTRAIRQWFAVGTVHLLVCSVGVFRICCAWWCLVVFVVFLAYDGRVIPQKCVNLPIKTYSAYESSYHQSFAPCLACLCYGT